MNCLENVLKKRELQEKKFEGKVEGQDFVRCKFILENGTVCDWPATRLTDHIFYHHNLRCEQYYKMFPDLKLTCSKLAKSTAFTGQHSQETKDKMRKAHLGKKKKKIS